MLKFGGGGKVQQQPVFWINFFGFMLDLSFMHSLIYLLMLGVLHLKISPLCSFCWF